MSAHVSKPGHACMHDLGSQISDLRLPETTNVRHPGGRDQISSVPGETCCHMDRKTSNTNERWRSGGRFRVVPHMPQSCQMCQSSTATPGTAAPSLTPSRLRFDRRATNHSRIRRSLQADGCCRVLVSSPSRHPNPSVEQHTSVAVPRDHGPAQATQSSWRTSKGLSKMMVPIGIPYVSRLL